MKRLGSENPSCARVNLCYNTLTMKTIIFDIETKNFFDTVHSNDPADLDISVVCLHDSQSNEYYSFTEEQFEDMWPYFQNADLLVTYNGNHFDIPCLNRYAPFDLHAIRHIDMFEDARNATGKKLGLDGIAQATLGIAKSGHGSDAIAWWNAGEIQKIIDYCIQDVKVTKAVYDYILANQSISFTDRATGEEKTVPIDTSSWHSAVEAPSQGGLF